MEANPDYYGDEVQMKKVVVLFMEEDAALAAVKAGQVDIAYTSAVYSDEQVDGYQSFRLQVSGFQRNLTSVDSGRQRGCRRGYRVCGGK